MQGSKQPDAYFKPDCEYDTLAHTINGSLESLPDKDLGIPLYRKSNAGGFKRVYSCPFANRNIAVLAFTPDAPNAQELGLSANDPILLDKLHTWRNKEWDNIKRFLDLEDIAAYASSYVPKPYVCGKVQLTANLGTYFPAFAEEFINAPTLAEAFSRGRLQNRSEEAITDLQGEYLLHLVRKLCLCVRSIHAIGVHRDLKPTNFSFDSNDRLTLLDWGTLVGKPTELDTFTSVYTSPPWSAPERNAEKASKWLYDNESSGFAQITHSPKLDVYSLGVIIAWLRCSHLLSKNNQLQHRMVGDPNKRRYGCGFMIAMMGSVRNDLRHMIDPFNLVVALETFGEHCSSEDQRLSELISACTEPHPVNRCTMDDLVRAICELTGDPIPSMSAYAGSQEDEGMNYSSDTNRPKFDYITSQTEGVQTTSVQCGSRVLMSDRLHYKFVNKYIDDEACTVLGSQFERKQISSVVFLNKLPAFSQDGWDVSENADGSVLAWFRENMGGMYDLLIAADGTIMAPEDFGEFFAGYVNLRRISFNSCLDTSSVTKMDYLFHECSSLSTLDLSSFSTSNVTTMLGLFKGCAALRSVNLQGLDTSAVTNMTAMFLVTPSLKSLDVSGFDTSKVTQMRGMFWGASSLKSLDLSSFDTRNVTDPFCMFYDCTELEELVLDPGKFDTSSMTTIESMFSCCKSLKSLDVSGFSTSKVTSMHSLFRECHSLRELDLSNWDMSQVTDVSCMFQGLTSSLAVYYPAGSIAWERGLMASDTGGSPSFVGVRANRTVRY